MTDIMETTTQTTNSKRLYKSRRNRMIDGVCGGIAEYFDIDPTIVRIIWILMTLLGGSGFILYIAGMIIMPVNTEHLNSQTVSSPKMPVNGTDKRRFWGIFLILIGAFILMINLGWVTEIHWWSFSRKIILPILFVLLGIVLIYIQRGKSIPKIDSSVENDSAHTSTSSVAYKELRRSASNKKLFGVCGGIAEYFEIDPTIVRILYVILVLASFGWALLLYIILAIIIPEEKIFQSKSI
jgi:phage shock protein C